MLQVLVVGAAVIVSGAHTTEMEWILFHVTAISVVVDNGDAQLFSSVYYTCRRLTRSPLHLALGMSLAPPDLPSPAPTPDGHPPPLPMTPAAGPVDPSDAAQSRLRAEIETQLLRLSQDLYEMEVCAGEVGKDMEGAVPQYL